MWICGGLDTKEKCKFNNKRGCV